MFFLNKYQGIWSSKNSPFTPLVYKFCQLLLRRSADPESNTNQLIGCQRLKVFQDVVLECYLLSWSQFFTLMTIACKIFEISIGPGCSFISAKFPTNINNFVNTFDFWNRDDNLKPNWMVLSRVWLFFSPF